jgi:hypothetical protein
MAKTRNLARFQTPPTLETIRKRRKSLKACLNELPIDIQPKNSRKRRQKTPTPPVSESSDTDIEEPSPEPESEVEDHPPPIFDVSDKTFELRIAVFLNKEPVKNSMDVIKLNSFNFQNTLAETIKEVARGSDNSQEAIKWVRAQAFLQYACLPKADRGIQDVADATDWENVRTLGNLLFGCYLAAIQLESLCRSFQLGRCYLIFVSARTLLFEFCLR